jgi:uncharacterized protein (TIGR03905 family)
MFTSLKTVVIILKTKQLFNKSSIAVRSNRGYNEAYQLRFSGGFKMHYQPSGVCARGIDFEIEGNIIKDVKFLGGCAGNTQGVAALIKGMDVNDAIARLKGIKCGAKGTSCPDQLSKALEEYISKKA